MLSERNSLKTHNPHNLTSVAISSVLVLVSSARVRFV